MAEENQGLLEPVHRQLAGVQQRVERSGIIDRIFTDRVLLVIGYITGAAGPLQRMFSWLRAHGIGERVVKSTIAAVTAYWLAGLIPNNPHPAFAPISAVFCINLTIAGGMHGAGQRVLGVLAGIMLAMVVHNQVSSDLVAVGIVVFISFYIGRLLTLEPTGTQQITMTALLIIFISDVSAFEGAAWLKVVNTLIGTAVGLVANASVAPTNMLPQARTDVLALGRALSNDLAQIAAAYRAGMTNQRAVELLTQARQTTAQVQRANDAVDLAAESLRYNLQARPLRETVARYRHAQTHFTHASFHCRTLARGTADLTAQKAPHDWLAPEALGLLIGDIVQVAADAIAERSDWIEKGDFDRLLPIDAATLEAKQSELIERIDAWSGELDHGGLFYIGEVVSLSVQLATEMADPATWSD